MQQTQDNNFLLKIESSQQETLNSISSHAQTTMLGSVQCNFRKHLVEA